MDVKDKLQSILEYQPIFSETAKRQSKILKKYEEAKNFYKNTIEYANVVFPMLSKMLEKQEENAKALKREMEYLSRLDIPEDTSDLKDKLQKSINKFLALTMSDNAEVASIMKDVVKKTERGKAKEKGFFESLFS